MFFRAFPLLIVALLSFGAVLQKDQKYSSQEKRELKTLDDIDFKTSNIQNIPTELDTYFKDQVFLKSSLLNLYTRFKLAIGDSPSEDVTLGKDYWFFLGSPVSKKYANLINYSSEFIQIPDPSDYLRTKAALCLLMSVKHVRFPPSGDFLILGDPVVHRLRRGVGWPVRETPRKLNATVPTHHAKPTRLKPPCPL